MSSSDKSNQRIEQTLSKLLGEYSRLVQLTLDETADGKKAKGLTRVVSNMTEARAKGMLIARIATEATGLRELTEQGDLDDEQDDDEPRFHGLGPDPTMN